MSSLQGLSGTHYVCSRARAWLARLPPAPAPSVVSTHTPHRRPTSGSPAPSLYFLRRPTISVVPPGASGPTAQAAEKFQLRGAFLTAYRNTF